MILGILISPVFIRHYAILMCWQFVVSDMKRRYAPNSMFQFSMPNSKSEPLCYDVQLNIDKIMHHVSASIPDFLSEPLCSHVSAYIP